MTDQRLYIVRNKRTGAPTHSCKLFFSDKVTAKQYRDLVIEETGEEFIVSPGPAHKKWAGW